VRFVGIWLQKEGSSGRSRPRDRPWHLAEGMRHVVSLVAGHALNGRHGFAAVLAKPFTAAELRSVLDLVLPVARGAEA
jgi:hypothetical protein